MRPRPLATVVTAALFCLVTSATTTASDRPSTASRTTLTLPGGRDGLLPRLGLRDDLPRALVVASVIRLVHSSHRSVGPALGSLRDYLIEPADTPDEELPVPLTATFWRRVLASPPADDRDLLGAILSDREASLLCYGLLALDGETLDAVAADEALLAPLTRNVGVFAAFPETVRIRQGNLVLPGGPDAISVWEAFTDGPLSHPRTALPALLARDGGRLAYFVDTLTALPDEQLAALFGTPAALELRRAHVRALYEPFRDIEPGWDIPAFPFVRVSFDPALFLIEAAIDSRGRVRGSRGFWTTVFDGRRIPAAPDTAFSRTTGPDADVVWLLDRLVDLQSPDRREFFRTLFFVQRALERTPGVSYQRIAAMGRAFRIAPALYLSLERAGLLDAEVSLALGRRAAELAGIGGGATFREQALGLFQGSVALVEIMARHGALPRSAALDLLERLATVPPGDTRALVRVFDETWLPALGFTADVDGLTRESLVLEALSGITAPVAPDLRTARVEWEGHEYRLDPAAPELVRLTDVRTRQAGNTLDDALALARVGQRLASMTTESEPDGVIEALRRLAESLAPIERSELPGQPTPPDVREVTARALRELTSGGGRDAVRRARTAARRLETVERAVLADVLTSLVYATALGDPAGRMFLAGNVARRHDYGTRERARFLRERTPWTLPRQASGDGVPWHVRGSLLALDVSLAEIDLRRTSVGLPDSRPTLGEVDKAVLLTTQALGSATGFDAAEAARILTWLRAGRRRLAAGGDAEAHDIARQLQLDGHRRQALAWSWTEDREALGTLLLHTELVLLGRPAGSPLPTAAWGAAQTPVSGCLCLGFPNPPALHRYLNRAGSGLLASRIADLTLATLEGLSDLDLPVVLLHGTLDSVLYDFLNAAQLADADDWWAFAAAARDLSRDTLVDYVAALTAGGPLVPTGRRGAPDRP